VGRQDRRVAWHSVAALLWIYTNCLDEEEYAPPERGSAGHARQVIFGVYSA
jgi:hypothetical protein